MGDKPSEAELFALTGAALVILCRDEHVRAGVTYKAIAQAAIRSNTTSRDWSKKIGDFIFDQCFDKLGPVLIGEYVQKEMRGLRFEERRLRSVRMIRCGLMWFVTSRGISALANVKALAEKCHLDKILSDREIGGRHGWTFEKIFDVGEDHLSSLFDESFVLRQERWQHWITEVALTATDRVDELGDVVWRGRERELLPPKESSKHRRLMERLYGAKRSPPRHETAATTDVEDKDEHSSSDDQNRQGRQERRAGDRREERREERREDRREERRQERHEERCAERHANERHDQGERDRRGMSGIDPFSNDTRFRHTDRLKRLASDHPELKGKREDEVITFLIQETGGSESAGRTLASFILFKKDDIAELQEPQSYLKGLLQQYEACLPDAVAANSVRVLEAAIKELSKLFDVL